MSTSHEEQQTGHHPTFMQYVVVAIILFVITMVEFLLIWDKVGISDDLGASKIPLLVALSAVKFAIVIMFYMHLKFDARLLSGMFLAGLALAFVVGIALLGLFFAYDGKPREFAEANAQPFVEHEEEAEEGSEPPSPSEPSTLNIGVEGDALKFDVTSIEVAAGSEVVLIFHNVSTVNLHNWVLVQSGTKDDVAAAGIAAGADNDWIPPGDARVLYSTRLLNAGESEEIRFTPQAGSYQFVCTFPGHNFLMFGDFLVTP